MMGCDQIWQCAKLLASVGESYWCEKLKSFADSAEQPWSVADIDEILSWYGGMGSFSDVYLSTLNDHDVTQENEDEVNSSLSGLRSSIYETAMKAKLELR